MYGLWSKSNLEHNSGLVESKGKQLVVTSLQILKLIRKIRLFPYDSTTLADIFLMAAKWDRYTFEW